MHTKPPLQSETTDVIIIGAGPLGIEMAIALQELGVDYLLVEARQIGHTISKWPPNTHFYSTPEHVALAGVPVHNLNQQPVSGEQYLAYLRMLVEYFDLNLRVYEPVQQLHKRGDGFTVITSTQRGPRTYHSRRLILATGGMARPRMLDIPGEELPHVRHYFPGPHPYFRRRVLIVGGKNSALEAALRCWRAGARVTLSYRRPEFDFEVVKPHLAADISTRLDKGEVDFLPATLPLEITPCDVLLSSVDDDFQRTGDTLRHDADAVLLLTGYEADMHLFKQLGAELHGPEQAPVYDPHTMETTVPDLYVVGTAAGGSQQKFRYFISTSHDHVARICRAITGRLPERLGSVDARNNAVSWEEVKRN